MPVIFFFFLLLLCYQDSPTAVLIGEIARSPIFLFLPALLVWHLSSRKLDGEAYRQVSNLFLFLIGIFILITVVNGLYWFAILQNGNSFLGENMIVKSLKEIMYFVQLYILYVCSVRFFTYFLPYRIPALKKVLTCFLIFLLLVLGLEILTMPNAFPFLHAETPYYRIRLLTSESSWTGSLVIALGCIFLTLASTRFEKAFGFFFLFLNVLVTGSKMIMVCFPIAFFLIYMRKFSFSKVLAAALLAGLAYVFVLPAILLSFAVDLEEYTSVISRSTSFATANLIGVKSIIGVGAFYPYYFIHNLNEGLAIVLNIIGFGNTTEVDAWGTDGFKSISGGSTFAHLVMQIGIFGLAFYYLLSKRLVALSRINNYLFFAVIYFIISNFFSEILLMRLTWPLFFAYLSLYKTNENAIKSINSHA